MTCLIAKKERDNTVRAIISCPNSSLPLIGNVLYQHYQDQNKIDLLLEHGDIQFLREDIDKCIFDHRDKGYALDDCVHTTYDDLQSFIKTQNSIPIYLWDSQWFYYVNRTKYNLAAELQMD